MKAKALALLVTGGLVSQIDWKFAGCFVAAVILVGLLEIFCRKNDR